MSFIDDYIRFAWIYLLKQKEDAKKAIKDYGTRIEKQYSTTILRFRTDGGCEYINKDTTNYFDTQGIVHEQTPPYTPESNGVAERFNRMGEAYATAVYLKNRLPHSTLKGKTPFEALKGTKPSIQHLQLFGKKCYVHIPENSMPAGSKLAPRAYEGIIVGYSDSNKIYRIWIATQHRVIESGDVTFPPPESGEVSVELDFISSVKPDAATAPSDDGYESEDRSDPEPESSAIEENLKEDASRLGAGLTGLTPGHHLTGPDKQDTNQKLPGDFPASPERKKVQLPKTPNKGKQPESSDPPPAPRRSNRVRKKMDYELDKEIRRKEYNNKVIQQQEQLKEYIESVRKDGPRDEGEQQAMIKEFKGDLIKARKDLDLEYQDVSNEPAIYRIRLVTEPSTYNQAMNSDDQHLWKKAIQTEKDAVDKAHTWDIVNRPTNRAV
ncbi:uncharacterized protein H6S33_001903, partial [Morchella sextelata]|uniref:uncharacterized protein n=1 Tax=Morchella sextelata TaxID=1174677 RepID=UPI001D042566